MRFAQRLIETKPVRACISLYGLLVEGCRTKEEVPAILKSYCEEVTRIQSQLKRKHASLDQKQAFLNACAHIAEVCQDAEIIKAALNAMCMLLPNRNFKRKNLPSDSQAAAQLIIHASKKLKPRPKVENKIELLIWESQVHNLIDGLGVVFRKSNFTPEMSGTVKSILDISAETLYVFSYILENQNFSPTWINDATIEKLLRISIAERGSHEIFAGISIGSVLRHPKFSLDLLDSLVYILDHAPQGFCHVVSLVFSLLSSNDQVIKDMNATLERGKRLAKTLRLDQNDLIVCLNLGHAISIIGEAKTSELHTRLGIVYFGRYTKELLEELYDNIHQTYNRERPLLLMVFNKADRNGAFYLLGPDLNKLTKYYKVIVAEVDSKSEFYTKVADIATTHSKIDTFFIGGHGEADRIRLGNDPINGILDIRDIDELKLIRKFFNGKVTVVLISCSTGKDDSAIGSLLSKAWGAELFAPREPTRVPKYILDNSGALIDVKYVGAERAIYC